MEQQLSQRVTLTTHDDSLVGETGLNRIQRLYTHEYLRERGFASDALISSPAQGSLVTLSHSAVRMTGRP